MTVSPSIPSARPGAPRSRAAARRMWVWALVLTAVAVVTAASFAVLDLASRRTPELLPRHRAEALCFTLAQPPAFAPSMVVQPSAALVRGRFNAGTPASFAVQELMGFGDERVLREWTEHVGDYDVAAFWLRLPGPENEHWLVITWMEDADLAVCNFRFIGTARVLSVEEKVWGERLMRRVLVPENFQRGTLPQARLRVSGRQTMPVFGPQPG
jgi:hypothetical protein